MTEQQFLDLRRNALLDAARYIATEARRARLVEQLDSVRSIGRQLDALDPASPAARDVLDAAAPRLFDIAEAVHEQKRIAA